MANMDTTDKVSTIKAIYQRLGVDEELKMEVDRYYLQALSHLESIAVNEERKTKIAGLAKALHTRQF